MTYEEYKAGLEELKKNEWYWKLDNEFNHKYAALLDYDTTTRGERAKLQNLMAFMLGVSRKIFG